MVQLIVINGAFYIVFLFINLFQQASGVPESSWLYTWLCVRAGVLETLIQPWSYITYMFMHVDFGHIFFNMLILYSMGRLLERYIGSRKVLAMYILGGLAGAVLYQLSYNVLHLMYPDNPFFMMRIPLLGASAGVLGIVVAVGILLPNEYVRIFLWPVKIKWVALLLFVSSTLVDMYANTGGKMAHIGGGILGYFFIRMHQHGRDLGKPVYWVLDRLPFASPERKRSRMRVVRDKPNRTRNDYDWNQQKAMSQRRTDEILDKISKSGYDSLTKEEKAYLDRISKG